MGFYDSGDKKREKPLNQKQIHDRGIRGFDEYQNWKKIAEFIEKAEPAEILRFISVQGRPLRIGHSSKKEVLALDLLLRDRYPSFMVMEKLRGREKNGE